MNWIDDTPPPAGTVRLEPGDVVRHGGELMLVVTVNDCRAWLEPLSKRHVERTTRFGQRVEFDAAGKGLGTSTVREPDEIVERRGRRAAEDFLAARARRRKERENGLAVTTNERTDDMPNKLRTLKGEKKTRKPRGGLAADMAAGEPVSAEAKPRRARKVKESKGGNGTVRPRASDEQVIAVIKSNPEFNDQKVVDTIRAAGNGCSVARAAELRKVS